METTNASIVKEMSVHAGGPYAAMIQQYTVFVLIVLILLFNVIAASAEEPNIGILRIRSFRTPRGVAPSSVFSVYLDVEYGVHGRPENDTIRAAIYWGDVNLHDPLWQSDPLILTWTEPWGGDKIWNINLTAPSAEGDFKLTAYAFYLDEGAWSFFNNSLNGPGFSQATIKVGKTAALDVELGIPDVPVTVDNVTVNTKKIGEAQMMLLVRNTYVVSIPDAVEFQNLTRIVFNGWSDGSTLTRRSVVFDENVRLIGSYKIQYLLQVNSPFSPYSEWHDAGSTIELQAETPLAMDSPLGRIFGMRYNFVDWTGDIKSTQPQLNITMNSPKILNVNYSVDYGPLILFSIIAATLTCVVLFIRERKYGFRSTNQLALRCDSCGERSDGNWAYCNHCGTEITNHRPDRLETHRFFQVSSLAILASSTIPTRRTKRIKSVATLPNPLVAYAM
jgi:hypothetical protein